MSTLLTLDCAFLHHAVGTSLRLGLSILLLFAFEYLILASTVCATFSKYALHLNDLRLGGRWDDKGVYLFYLELITDLFHMLVYLAFFVLICTYYGLPLHIMRDLYLTIRSFRTRVADFIRYRRITHNMNDRFPDATEEELDRTDRICIICRSTSSRARSSRAATSSTSTAYAPGSSASRRAQRAVRRSRRPRRRHRSKRPPPPPTQDRRARASSTRTGRNSTLATCRRPTRMPMPRLLLRRLVVGGAVPMPPVMEPNLQNLYPGVFGAQQPPPQQQQPAAAAAAAAMPGLNPAVPPAGAVPPQTPPHLPGGQAAAAAAAAVRAAFLPTSLVCKRLQALLCPGCMRLRQEACRRCLQDLPMVPCTLVPCQEVWDCRALPYGPAMMYPGGIQMPSPAMMMPGGFGSPFQGGMPPPNALRQWGSPFGQFGQAVPAGVLPPGAIPPGGVPTLFANPFLLPTNLQPVPPATPNDPAAAAAAAAQAVQGNGTAAFLKGQIAWLQQVAALITPPQGMADAAEVAAAAAGLPTTTPQQQQPTPASVNTPTSPDTTTSRIRDYQQAAAAVLSASAPAGTTPAACCSEHGAASMSAASCSTCCSPCADGAGGSSSSAGGGGGGGSAYEQGGGGSSSSANVEVPPSPESEDRELVRRRRLERLSSPMAPTLRGGGAARGGELKER